jgi:hypothetical protein
MTTPVQAATQQYIDHKARTTHPDGKFDSGGRWHPSDQEQQPCCSSIRNPSRAWPYSLLLHCRTAKHIATMHEVSAAEIRKAARATQL